ncbi:hypothetical protein NE236_02150 [Actinoallomurus purpureus]|uniref:hypothetical protein n=1 Tax=Actinoallomurus purpureus TaxID=478114 RepID=UPI0020920D62|nr:hypothetical protein [Actinoallomurus purpureus]MCO6003770.1 hypothetical protein [Actinoallomurus purpureus]
MHIGHHRKFTANHTFHADWRDRRLFVKILPNLQEAAAEIAGHRRLRDRYEVPRLVGHRTFRRYAIHAYERIGDDRGDSGLLLDDINIADLTGHVGHLDQTVTALLSRYETVIHQTLRRARPQDTVTKLYADRAAEGGRLDRYYRHDPDLLIVPGGDSVRPSQLRALRLVVNGEPHRIDFSATIRWLRRTHCSEHTVWAGLTQGDPTDVNLGPGPIWFDYDTGGINALAGEFAGFLWYQLIQGGWLVPAYNTSAFADHPATFACMVFNKPAVQFRLSGSSLAIDYHHRASMARRHVIARYLNELVRPIAAEIGISCVMKWLRPYLVMRILGVYNLADLNTADAALSLAYLAQVLSPGLSVDELFADIASREKETQ